MKRVTRLRSKRSARSAGKLKVDPLTSARLGRVRQRDTTPEQLVRQMLRGLGGRPGRSKQRLPGSPDILNLSQRWAVLVHGCYWHAHEGCRRATVPKRNRAFWQAKFAANRDRDARVIRELRGLGFRVCVVWECEVYENPQHVRAVLLRCVGAATSPRPKAPKNLDRPSLSSPPPHRQAPKRRSGAHVRPRGPATFPAQVPQR